MNHIKHLQLLSYACRLFPKVSRPVHSKRIWSCITPTRTYHALHVLLFTKRIYYAINMDKVTQNSTFVTPNAPTRIKTRAPRRLRWSCIKPTRTCHALHVLLYTKNSYYAKTMDTVTQHPTVVTPNAPKYMICDIFEHVVFCNLFRTGVV